MLDVARNQLGGPLPSLAGAPLGWVRLNGNAFVGAPPIPASQMQAGQSRLCPSTLDPVPDPAWDAATGVSPWFAACADALFEDGFEPR